MALKFCRSSAISHNVYRPLRPLSFILMLTLAPFLFYKDHYNKVQTSKCFFVVSILHFLSYLYFFFNSYFGDPAIRFTGFIAMSTIFFFVMSKRQSLVSIIQNHIIVDDIFARLGVNLNNQRITQFNRRISIGMVIFNFLYFCTRYKTFYRKFTLKNVWTLLSFALPHINVTLMVLKFLCLTHLVKARFNMLNEILRDILDAEENTALELTPKHSEQSALSIVRRDPENAVKEVSKIHSLLCDICEAIEEYFTYPLLVTIAISFWFIVFDNFHLLDALMIHKLWDSFLWGCFTQVLWSIAFIFLIVEASSNTISCSSSSGQWVHKILNATDDPQLKDRLSRLSLQLIHRKVNFTAARLLSLDRALLLTIAGSATCYLIILMQSRTKEFIEESADYNYTDYT